jgi:hypothetical protein
MSCPPLSRADARDLRSPTHAGSDEIHECGVATIGVDKSRYQVANFGSPARPDMILQIKLTIAIPCPLRQGVCGGAISAGAIKFQGGSFGTEDQGQFTITMTFTPPPPTSNTPCQTTDYTLLCNRTLLHKNLANDLNAGQYHCVAQDVTVGGNPVGASLEGHLDIVSGSNGTNS